MRKLNVLMIDDDRGFMEEVAAALARRGHAVRYLTDAKKALSYLEGLQHSKKVGDVDVVVSDWMMPGMNGVEFLKTFRAQNAYSKIPFVLMSGAVTADDLLSVLHLGADALLLKPFQFNKLIEKIEEAIRVRAKKFQQQDPKAIGKTV